MEKKKTKSSSLPRDLKSPFGRPSSKSKSGTKDTTRRRTLDLDNIVHIRTLGTLSFWANQRPLYHVMTINSIKRIVWHGPGVTTFKSPKL